MQSSLIRTSAGASLLALALCLTPSLSAADASAKRDAELSASSKLVGASARDIIGQKIKSSTGEKIGDVKDLVISPSGRVLYALTSSGGVLGVGDKIRAVPFSALRHKELHDGTFTLDLSKAKWDAAPYVTDDDVDLLSTNDRGKVLYEYYGQEWRSEPAVKVTAATLRSDQVVRASTLMGKNLTSAGQKVGEVEDIVVDVSHHRASALIDPDQGYTGAKDKFLVGFDRLMRNPDKKDAFSTTLTRADFERASPARSDWSSLKTGEPVVWTGYSYNKGLGYTTAYPGAGSRDASVLRDERSMDHQISAADVRSTLERDPVLGDAARHVVVRAEGNKLVLRGTAATKELKERIEDRVESVAKGWKVDNEIEVRAAAE